MTTGKMPSQNGTYTISKKAYQGFGLTHQGEDLKVRIRVPRRFFRIANIYVTGDQAAEDGVKLWIVAGALHEP